MTDFAAEGECTGGELKELLVLVKNNLFPDMPEKEFRELIGINAHFPLNVHSIGHLKRLCDTVNNKDMLGGKVLKCKIEVWVE